MDPNYYPSSGEEADDSFVNKRKNKVVRNVFRDLVFDKNEVANNEIGEDTPNKSEEKKKSRKRKREPDQWEKNLRKEKRLTGEKYINRGGKMVEKRTLKPSCHCRKKCYDKLSADDRSKMHNKFWALRSWDQRKQFVRLSVHSAPISRNRPRNSSQEGRRKLSYEYRFTLRNETISVCKVMFLNTLSIGEKFLRNSIQNHDDTTCMSTPDKRQKHQPTRIIGQKAKEIAKRHIECFPVTESHYARNSTTKKYLDPCLNITTMYKLYKDYCEENNVDPVDIIKESYYRFLFVTEYNFAFKLPSLDTCDDCDRFQRRLLDVKDEEGKESILKEKDLHQIESERRYKNKQEDKMRSRLEDSKERVCTIDLQKCLPTPCLTNAQSFYKLKLWTLNFTVCDMTVGQTHCMVWNESTGKRGSNEIASGLLKYLSTLPQDVQEVTFWSDNCAGQNRNVNILFFYTYVLHKFTHLKTVNHKFLLKGHTHMEVDVAHSVIEHKRRHTKTMDICDTHDWAQLIRLSCHKKPFIVYEMELKDFLSFDKLGKSSTSPLVSRKKNCNNEEFQLSKVVQLQFKKEQLGLVNYKTSFDDAVFKQVSLIRQPRKALVIPDTIPVLSNTLRRIKTQKYRHLQDLLPWIPEALREYYIKLPHGQDEDSEDND